MKYFNPIGYPDKISYIRPQGYVNNSAYKYHFVGPGAKYDSPLTAALHNKDLESMEILLNKFGNSSGLGLSISGSLSNKEMSFKS